MYVKRLSDGDKELLMVRRNKIKEYQNRGTYILKVSDAIIKLHKEILGAKKVYMCTICDGKRNHLHFQLFPRLEGDTTGYLNFVKDEGILMDYKETAELFRDRLKNMLV